MTPQQKAEELMCKMSDPMGTSKQRALIAIDEMIEQNGELYLKGIAKEYYLKKNSELFEVKTEIEKI